uniref:C1q domain-containing protein n=1 Tax=Salmo trutta TaxID=8032 RepID=A0A673Y277_SALTR
MKATAFLMASLSSCLSMAQEDTPMTEHEVECTTELQNSCYMLTLITEFRVMEEKLQTTVEKTANNSGKNEIKRRQRCSSPSVCSPVRGVYYFSFFFHAGGSEDSHTTLFKNGECMPITSDPKSITLQLGVGDQVYIRLRANAHVWPSHTSFNGFLLSQV